MTIRLLNRNEFRLSVVVFVLGACNDLAGINAGILRDAPNCSNVSDCVIEVPDCRMTKACEAGRCIFEDVADGTALAEQAVGDCAQWVCDGAGRKKLVPLPDDPTDDGDPCTFDACGGMQSTHEPMTVLPCYAGPAGTKGVGLCRAGIQTCDADGRPVSGCEGQIVPVIEICDDAAADEDCDGQIDEASEYCYCGDGHLAPDEICDDGNQEPTDECTTLCKPAACGDGWVQAGEVCDDGNTVGNDACPPDCSDVFITQVVMSGDRACAVFSNGQLKCWGANQLAQLGLEDKKDRGDEPGEMGANLPPVNLGLGNKVVAVLLSGVTCALLEGGNVKCWGLNQSGGVGLGKPGVLVGGAPGDMGDALPYLDLGTGKLVKSLALDTTCALLTDGALKCWGWNAPGKLGLGDTNNRGDDPNEMGDNLPAVNLGAGLQAVAVHSGRQTCAIVQNGRVKCWGWFVGDEPGEMGDNLPFINLGTGAKVVALAVGTSHQCALLEDGTVKCWGDGKYGKLGYENEQILEPLGDAHPVVNLGAGRKAVAIGAGGYHTCALLDNQTIKCWGSNHDGALGVPGPMTRGALPGDMGDNLPAVDLGTGKLAVALTCGLYSNCAILNDKTVKCWGLNDRGQLGLGDKIRRGFMPGQMGDNLPVVKLR